MISAVLSLAASNQTAAKAVVMIACQVEIRKMAEC